MLKRILVSFETKWNSWFNNNCWAIKRCIILIYLLMYLTYFYLLLKHCFGILAWRQKSKLEFMGHNKMAGDLGSCGGVRGRWRGRELVLNRLPRLLTMKFICIWTELMSDRLDRFPRKPGYPQSQIFVSQLERNVVCVIGGTLSVVWGNHVTKLAWPVSWVYVQDIPQNLCITHRSSVVETPFLLSRWANMEEFGKSTCSVLEFSKSISAHVTKQPKLSAQRVYPSFRCVHYV